MVLSSQEIYDIGYATGITTSSVVILGFVGNVLVRVGNMLASGKSNSGFSVESPKESANNGDTSLSLPHEDGLVGFFEFFTSHKLPERIRGFIMDARGTSYNLLHDYYNALSVPERAQFEKDILEHVDEITSIDQMIVHFLFGLSYKQARDFHLDTDNQSIIGEDTTGHIMDDRESFATIGADELSLEEVATLYKQGKLSKEERDFFFLVGINPSRKEEST